MRKDERYNLRGVSASKEDVHSAIKNLDKGLYPNAFCKVVPDFLAGDAELFAILCMPMAQEQNHLLPTCIGRKQEIFLYGRALLRMH